ncbi:2-polyprenyl-6-methoxyphenol hydroxylase-like FAD-dependent oxidoreductase [Thermocatellispora tengchongensis]|uniref:Flavin-dependent monooxygenase n=1 Tax=Thermocatellispora tengchongensis TaxID=1073253 RepID=A0A840PS07_9ACTN|nr:NAD(P)/FAD-dependent oxidoreductase [Thermocatellispora tengchongensis]MBB5138745.1 2-polyprenyl-6-methoxyphenol hydroxylase-like FAD-dependent oxidoreductase [Thermocatellispora tengchongensis]
MRTPRIAVAGAGPGGLTLARVLQTHGLPVTVFEIETAPGAREQGGTLDMHAGVGQLALAKAGLLDRFRVLSRPEGQEQRTLDESAALLRHRLPAPGEETKPEIDRGVLRELLIESLAPGTVQWGRGVDAATPLPDGTCRLSFRDGSAAEFDLVVGADGAWSRVRPAVSPGTPEYTGVTYVETVFEDADARHPAVAELVGDGGMAAYGRDRALIAQRNGNGRIRVYAAFRGPRDWDVRAGVDLGDGAATRAYLLGLFDGWDERLRDLLRGNDGPFVNRPLFALPVPHRWEHVPGVTLLGDAAHLMPPLGVGANLAMLEGAELAEAVAAGPDLDAAVRAYERVMLPRAERAARFCADGLAMLISPDGVEGALRLYERLAEARR